MPLQNICLLGSAVIFVSTIMACIGIYIITLYPDLPTALRYSDRCTLHYVHTYVFIPLTSLICVTPAVVPLTGLLLPSAESVTEASPTVSLAATTLNDAPEPWGKTKVRFLCFNITSQ